MPMPTSKLWWEEVTPAGDTDGNGIPDTNTDQDPIRTAHMAIIEQAVTEYSEVIKAGLMMRFQKIYNNKNGLATVRADGFMGMGLFTACQFEQLMVDNIIAPMRDEFQRFIHPIMIPQYRCGERLVEMGTQRVFVVEATPNRMTIDPRHGFMYQLKAEDTNLIETVPASVVEDTCFVRFDASVHGVQPPTGSVFNAVQTIRTDGDIGCSTGCSTTTSCCGDNCCGDGCGCGAEVPHEFNHCNQ